MKKSTLTLLITLIFTMKTAQANTEKDLSSVKVFSLGSNGFIAKKMPQQVIFEKTLNDENAVYIFERIITNPVSTPESKAYAACGLMMKGVKDRIPPEKDYKALEVTVLKGDILRKEALSEIISNMLVNGC